MGPVLFDKTIDALAESLTIRQRRHDLIASNLANVETPGFHARELDFRTALRQAFDDSAVSPVRPSGRVVEDAEAPARADGNTVDVDMQMAKLSENTFGYVVSARLLAKEFEHLREAIDGTR